MLHGLDQARQRLCTRKKAVILAERDWPKWLGEEPATEEGLKTLLVPCPSEELRLWPVDKRVGNVRNKGPELAQPLPLLV